MQSTHTNTGGSMPFPAVQTHTSLTSDHDLNTAIVAVHMAMCGSGYMTQRHCLTTYHGPSTATMDAVLHDATRLVQYVFDTTPGHDLGEWSAAGYVSMAVATMAHEHDRLVKHPGLWWHLGERDMPYVEYDPTVGAWVLPSC